MAENLTFRRDPIRGRRINATPESDISQEGKRIEQDAKKEQRMIRRSRVLSVASVVFLWLPFVVPIVFFIRNAAAGQAMPFLLYPLLVLTYRFSAISAGCSFTLPPARQTRFESSPAGVPSRFLFCRPRRIS
jgi:hypothetical protein